jgi:ribosomal protein S18 acetylase RimI-like enzyme
VGTAIGVEIAVCRVGSQLGAYNAAFTAKGSKLLRVFARDADGSIIGGLLADTYWQYLEIHKLWVSEAHRKAGHASRLINAAGAEARRRGCEHAFLDTFSFQALGFYQKLGYSEFGRLEESAANMTATTSIKGLMTSTFNACPSMVLKARAAFRPVV